MKKLLIFGVLLLFGNSLMAQDYIFKVLLNKGNNTIERNGETIPVKTGTSLQAGDMLSANGEVYVGLIHQNGQTIELREAKKYKVDDLGKQVSAKSNSVIAKYGQYVINKMSDEEGSGKNLKVTGAVERGSEGVISVYLPYSNELFGKKAVVEWDQLDEVTEYEVILKNKFDEEIKMLPVEGNTLAIDLEAEDLTNESLLIVSVKASGNDGLSSSDYGIKKMTEQEYDEIKAEYESLEGITQGSTLEDLLIASFFEEKNLLIDAIARFHKAMEDHPEMGDFQILYEDFLFRNGLKE
jgi:hypothetical protein